jgi:pilus assembly protein CpaB
MKKNLMPLLGVAFVAAVIATGIFYGLLINRLNSPDSVAASSGQVVVAARSLDRGSALKADDMKTIDWHGGKAPAGSVSDPNQVLGLTLLEPLAASEPLLMPHLAPRGSMGGASLAIPAGMRALSIHPGESSGVVALLRSGSRVDLQLIDKGPGGQLVLRRLLDNVEVLSTGGGDGSGGRPVVTVLVKPADADRLSLADASTQIRLLLRNPNEKDSPTAALR